MVVQIFGESSQGTGLSPRTKGDPGHSGFSLGRGAGKLLKTFYQKWLIMDLIFVRKPLILFSFLSQKQPSFKFNKGENRLSSCLQISYKAAQPPTIPNGKMLFP